LALYRTPGLGEILVLGQNAFVENNLPGWTRPGVITPDVLDAYRWPFPDYWSRVAILANPRDIPVGDHPSTPTMQAIADGLHQLAGRPVEIVWGMRDRAIPPPLIKPWLAAFPDAHVTQRPDDGHYIQEDAPDAVIDAIRRVLASLGGSKPNARAGP
jgi:haloalkane dehalogenase